MATLTSWVEHLTTDVDSATEGMQVAGEIYPMVGTEGWLLLIGVVVWLAWHVATHNSEAEELKNWLGNHLDQMLIKISAPNGNIK